MKRFFFAFFFMLCIAVAVSHTARTAEGMYPMHDTSTWPVEDMKKAGLRISAAKLLELRSAIAKVASGGTGSFISAHGLLVTNHHVAYRCIAALNGMERHKGIMEKGFVAKNDAEELPCPGYDLLIVENIMDVTKEVLEKVPAHLRGHKRFEALRHAREDLEVACENQGQICEAASLDGGRFYHMMVYRRIRDVRLVYTPENDIGNYGGDIDNWMYPRHTGDYAFLRAYVNSAGEGASYSETNVPLNPTAYLRVSESGVNRNDFVLVMGFPATTKRNFPSASAHFYSQKETTIRSSVYSGLIDVINKAGERDEKTRRRYLSLDAALRNATKYYSQSLEGFEKWEIVSKRRAEESKAKNELGASPKKAVEFEKLLKQIDKGYDLYTKDYQKHFYLSRITSMVRSVSVAYDIARWTEERTKPEVERKEAKYKTKNVYRIFEASDRLDDQITQRGEIALLSYLLHNADKQGPQTQLQATQKLVHWGKKKLSELKKTARKEGKTLNEHYQEITGRENTLPEDPVDLAVHLAYAYTSLLAHGNNRDERERALYQRRKLFFNSSEKSKRFKDPLLNFARELHRELTRVEKGSYRQIEETFETELRSQYANLMAAKYPDANFQVRLTYGIVDDYTSTADGKKHPYMTTLAGVIAKDRGQFPFRVPPLLKQSASVALSHRYSDKNLRDIPVNFTATLDTTGGNSGSPVLDAHGRLVGLLFDGTPESILSDWQFLPDDQRSICLDIRYALFLADTVHKATHLLREIGLSP